MTQALGFPRLLLVAGGFFSFELLTQAVTSLGIYFWKKAKALTTGMLAIKGN